MKKIICLLSAAAFMLTSISFAAAEGYSMEISAMIDPAEQKLLISGETSKGPDSRISAVVSDDEGKMVYVNECVSAAGGAFKLDVDINGFKDGEYKAVFRAEDTENAEYSFTLPIPAGNAVKLSASVAGNNFFLIKDNAPEEGNSTVELNINNAKIVQGKLGSGDIEITGLPEGYSIDARAVSDSRITLSLQGTGSVDKIYDIGIRLKSTVIKGGNANTSSDIITGIKIYPEDISKKVNITVLSGDVRMKDERNIDPASDSAELKVDLRKLSKTGLLEKDTDYSITLPNELNGLKTEVSANASEGKIRIKFSGAALRDIKKDVVIDNIIIKSASVTGAAGDSDPISITVRAQASSGGASSEGSSSPGGGGGGGGGYSGSNKQTTVIPPVVPTEKKEFIDCIGHWAEEEINTLAGEGIVNGVGNNYFEPNRTISRAEFVTIIVRAFGIKDGQYDGSFSDVKYSDWYSEYIGKALSAGIISKDSTFRPNDPIKREEMVKVIVGAWLLENERPQWVNSADFSDKQKVSDWAKDPLDLAVTLGLIKGDENNRFNPQNSTTRAEAAAVVYRLLYLN